jgi:hypothetical protein
VREDLAIRRGIPFYKGSVAAELANPAKRGDSVLEKKVKQQKRAILAAGSEKNFYNGYSIENVSCFKYLGAKLMSHGSDEEQVFDRIEKAQGAFRSRSAIWRNRRVPLNLKIRL